MIKTFHTDTECHHFVSSGSLEVGHPLLRWVKSRSCLFSLAILELSVAIFSLATSMQLQTGKTNNDGRELFDVNIKKLIKNS